MSAGESHVLLVEDSDDVRAVVAEFLQEEGCAVTAVDNGRTALAVLDALAAGDGASPAVVLLDWKMPLLDGEGFVRAYHGRPGPHLPIVIITAATGPDLDKLTAMGFAGVVAKPFALDDLLRALSPYLACLQPTPADPT